MVFLIIELGSILNKLLHPIRTFLFHLFSNMTVDIQSKGGGGMSQVALHRFDVVPAFYRGHRIRGPKLVEAENEGILVEVENRI